jgi:hypothetical protein
MAIDITSWFTGPKDDTRSRQNGKALEKQPAVSPHRAVGIVPGLVCCKAAANLKGRRHLSGEAPKLPLPECDAKSCGCKYAHYKDRRDGDDRRGMRLNIRHHSMPDRRRGRGSRVDD